MNKNIPNHYSLFMMGIIFILISEFLIRKKWNKSYIDIG